MKNVAIVLAGGKGSRMNSDIPKQYMELCGRPVLYYSLKAFEDSIIDEIILVAGKGEIEYCQCEIVKRYGFNKVKTIVEGGTERYFSVLNGLRAISVGGGIMAEGVESDGSTREGCYVFIHDGARPCVTEAVIERCMSDVVKYGACVAAVPVKDTIKVADEDGFAKMTPDRSYLWQIQTPQCFEYNLVKTSYEEMATDENRGNITDDAMVVERYSDTKVKLTMGAYENIKITTPEDIMSVEKFLNKA